ncbi:hypothetical protein pb186bvf_008806 [Paramecium bursaria]
MHLRKNYHQFEIKQQMHQWLKRPIILIESFQKSSQQDQQGLKVKFMQKYTKSIQEQVRDIEKSEQKDLQYQFLNQQNRLEKLIYQCVIDMIQKELGSLVIYDKQQDQSRESKRSFDKFKTKKSDMLHLIKLTSLRTRFSTLNLELSIQYLWNLTNYAWIEIDDNNIYYVKESMIILIMISIEQYYKFSAVKTIELREKWDVIHGLLVYDPLPQGEEIKIFELQLL